MEFATCCGMELTQSVEWNQCGRALHGIKTEGNGVIQSETDAIRGQAAMPYNAYALIPYQALRSCIKSITFVMLFGGDDGN